MLEAGLITSLLIFNMALLGHFRRTAQNAALALLKQHLSLKARVRRDGQWVALPATLLVAHDAVAHARSRCARADGKIETL
jgi:H+-transporting ATPase